MNRKQIDHFFQVLDRELGEESRVILTGAAAGSLYGNVRPSADIDFGVELKRKNAQLWGKVEEAVARTSQLTGIPANFAEEIGQWGLITLLDYRKHLKPYRRFGGLRLYLLDPATWSIGKMTRYLDPDVSDMVTVFKHQRVSAEALVRLWGRALRLSHRTTALLQFRRQVEDFLRRYGRAIWGKTFDPERTIQRFYERAGIKT
jgi:hypothetical protein